MHPVDPGAAVSRIHWPGAAQDDDRQPVSPGVINRHRRMLQTDDIMHRGGHRPACGARVAVSQRHGDLFMIAENDLRRMIAAIVDQRIVQAAEGRSRIDRDILDLEGFDRIDDDIRAPLGPRLFEFLLLGHGFCLSRATIRSTSHEHDQVIYFFGISMPRCTAGRWPICSYQRFTLGYSSNFTLWPSCRHTQGYVAMSAIEYSPARYSC